MQFKIYEEHIVDEAKKKFKYLVVLYLNCGIGGDWKIVW